MSDNNERIKVVASLHPKTAHKVFDYLNYLNNLEGYDRADEETLGSFLLLGVQVRSAALGGWVAATDSNEGEED